MRLALIIDDYLPYSTRVGAKMMHELAKEFTDQYCEVTIITPHFDKSSSRLIKERIEDIEIWRFYSGPIKDIGKVTRAINECLLSLRAWNAIKAIVKTNTFDGIVFYSPSIFFGLLVAKLKIKCNCRSYLILRDFFPQWAIDAGLIKKGSLIEFFFRKFEAVSYQNANNIGVMSQKNMDVFLENPANKEYCVSILRNWANLTPHVLKKDFNNLRIKLQLLDKVIFFYGGNIGHAQDMPNLMRLAKNMQPYKDAHFLFIGQGDQVDTIKSLAKEWMLENFTYLPSVNQEEFKDILAQVDIGLFSLSANHTAHNFPGKLLGYMVQSLPILGSVNQHNDLIELINADRSGMISINGDDDKLFKNAVELYESKVLRTEIGNRGYNLLKSEFDVSHIASSILKTLRNNNESVRSEFS
ncbi:glycosyltransferase family 4 protein [Pectobacterium versatile]|uniref:Glycosyltransferase family 4 protein n=1 Tax=Pectobacterium versatile TaxID=2488639 RepID=A0ABU8K0M6_9GAMM|nr:glycosyltransferase family 4 protein [Pectobacterium carotovorum]MCH4996225.1 glycosyltransferase family 4 protein [Pectobacterium carotovorum]